MKLILDDSGHRKNVAATDGVGLQYIREIGKTDNGILLLTTYLHDELNRTVGKTSASLPGLEQSPSDCRHDLIAQGA